MCARQSGKTWGDLGVLLSNALEAPGCKSLFLGLKGTGVKEGAWLDWRDLLDKHGIDRKDNQTELLTVLPSGSRVKFGGTDDLENVKKFLGKRLDHGVVVIDEAQDQKDGVLRYIIDQLLPPMLTETSRVILSGVLPDVAAGLFYQLAADRPLSEAPELAQTKGWSHHEWGRASNVHTPEAMRVLDERMKRFGLTVDDPQIARDYFMRRVWDKSATAYGYDAARNAYAPQEPAWLTDALEEIQAAIRKSYPARAEILPFYQRTVAPPGGDARYGIMAAVPRPGVEHISAAIDQGRGDRLSLSVTGWGSGLPHLQHLFEFSSPRDAALTLGQLVPVMRVVQRYYGPMWWYMDGTVNEIDTFRSDCGIPAIKAPNKQDMPGQVKRSKDHLQQGLLLVMAGSAAEQDMQRAKFDLDARLRGQYKWASAWHPDPSESLRYSTGPFWDSYKPDPTEADAARQRYLDGIERAVRNAERTNPTEYDRNEFESDLFDDME